MAARKAHRAVDDTEGHELKTQRAVEDDTEGHGLLLDPGVARDVARIRDREIQRRAERHGQEEEARRPHKPKAK
jgi:hypothetical protein